MKKNIITILISLFIFLTLAWFYAPQNTSTAQGAGVGESCALDSDCRTGDCADGKCYCEKYFLVIPLSPPECLRKKTDGERCRDNNQCLSNLCITGECTASRGGTGAHCYEDDDCLSGSCIDDICAGQCTCYGEPDARGPGARSGTYDYGSTADFRACCDACDLHVYPASATRVRFDGTEFSCIIACECVEEGLATSPRADNEAQCCTECGTPHITFGGIFTECFKLTDTSCINDTGCSPYTYLNRVAPAFEIRACYGGIYETLCFCDEGEEDLRTVGLTPTPETLALAVCARKYPIDVGCERDEQCASNYCQPGELTGTCRPAGERGTQAQGGQKEKTKTLTEEEVFPTYPIKTPIGEVTAPQLIGRIIKTILALVGAFALAMFVYGGFTWLTSGGSPDRIKKGKDILMWAVIGLVVIFASYTLVDFILKAFGL